MNESLTALVGRLPKVEVLPLSLERVNCREGGKSQPARAPALPG